MKLAVAQLYISSKKEQNLQKILTFIEKAAAENADMLILPELAQGVAVRGDKVRPNALSESLEGPFVKAIQKAAQRHRLYVACGIYETNPNDANRPYNTLVVIDATGELLYSYRKTHLYDTARYQESDFISAGDKAPQIVATEFGLFGFFTCYELRFPEVARGLALQGAEAFFVPTAWVKGSFKREQLDIFARARAAENGVFTAVADQCGNAYCGGSGIYAPSAVELSKAEDYTKETLLIAEIDFEKGRNLRHFFPSLEQRQNDLYKI